MTRSFATLLATSLVATPPLVAQDAAEICHAMQRIAVGNWVEYQITGGPGMMGAAQGTTIRQAVVETESVGGTEHYWFESTMETPMGGVVVQMLVPGWPYETQQVKAVVMKMGDQPAMRLPAQTMEMMRSQMPENPSLEAVQGCSDGEVLGWESVTVPAGTFRALHVRPAVPAGAPASEVWVSPDVPFGIVKVTLAGAEGGEIVLVGQGNDATSSIGNRPGQ